MQDRWCTWNSYEERAVREYRQLHEPGAMTRMAPEKAITIVLLLQEPTTGSKDLDGRRRQTAKRIT